MYTVSKEPSVFSGLFDKGRLHGFASFAIAMCMLLSALTTLVATAPSVDAADPIQYKLGTKAEPDTFNPFSMVSGTSWSVAHMMYEFLYAVGPMMEPYPQLAVSHEILNDNMTWIYHLAEDSTWHDGQAVTADDVVFTFEMIMRNPVDCALVGDYLIGFDQVIPLDEYTVQIDLVQPKANMLSLIVPILPEHIWSLIEDAGEISKVGMWDSTFFPEGPVGSGPLILDEWDKTGGWVRLLKNDPYHRLRDVEVDSINVDEVLFVVYANDAQMITALDTGAIDVVDGVPPMSWVSTIANPDIDGQEPAAHILEEFGFNCAGPETRESVDDQGKRNFPKASTNYETCNLSVRKAMTMATDVPYIATNIHQGLAVPADSLIPTATPFWHYYVPDDEYYHFDIAAANELLNESGYNQFDGSGFGFAGVRENETSGAMLEFDFYIIRGILADEMTAEQMQIWWEQIGVKVNIFTVAEGTLMNMWFNMEYDLFIWSWWPDVDPSWFLVSGCFLYLLNDLGALIFQVG